MTTIFDAMPVSVLEELERIEIAIKDMENRAFILEANSQDLRTRYADIITSWKVRAERGGLDSLIAERTRQDEISWILDPLPNGIPTDT